jgi:signal transduction histidine kinase
VIAREEERRRLRRDLHDGLGSTLAALGLQVGAVRALLPTDPAADAQALELRAGIRVAIADIRRLAYELWPPALDELGLIGALRARAAQYEHTGDGVAPQVTIDAPEDLPSLPAAVEVAAYRIAQEALTNVTRHAQARACVVRLALDQALSITIVDDGVGIPSARRSGVGLLSMRERAAELGGACTIEPAAGGGTCVRASLPLMHAARKP